MVQVRPKMLVTKLFNKPMITQLLHRDFAGSIHLCFIMFIIIYYVLLVDQSLCH